MGLFYLMLWSESDECETQSGAHTKIRNRKGFDTKSSSLYISYCFTRSSQVTVITIEALLFVGCAALASQPTFPRDF